MRTIDILRKHKFFIKKKYGQNFLIDDNILKNIVIEAKVNKKVGVIEIGPGIGSLTRQLAEKAKFVLAYEIDKDLLPILDETLKEYDNIKILNKDILKASIKTDISKYLKDVDSIYVVANLPYYITTPILFHFLENKIPVTKMVLMMQEEVANRISGTPKTKEYNALSVIIQYRGKTKKLMNVSNTAFMPSPKVNSSVLEIDLYKEPKYFPSSEIFFTNFVKSSFAQRRKTLVNNLVYRYQRNKELFEKVLISNNYKITVRAEELSIEELVLLSNKMNKELENGETLDVYNIKREKQKKTITRGDNLKDGEYFLISVAIINDGERILIQQRASTRLCYANLWSIPGGAVGTKENSLQGVKREVFEEMGIKIPKKKFKLFTTIISDENNAILDVYEAYCPKDTKVIINEEVSDYKWATKEQIIKMYNKNKFVDKDFDKLLLFFEKF